MHSHTSVKPLNTEMRDPFAGAASIWRKSPHHSRHLFAATRMSEVRSLGSTTTNSRSRCEYRVRIIRSKIMVFGVQAKRG